MVNGRSERAALLASVYNANLNIGRTNKEAALQAAFIAGGFHAVDSVYKRHVFVIESEEEHNRIFVKKRESENIARHEEEVLRYLAEKRGLDLGRLFPVLEICRLGPYVLCPDIGPEMEVVYHELNRKIEKLEKKEPERQKDLIRMRRAFVLSQVDALSDAITDPDFPEISLISSEVPRAEKYEKVDLVTSYRKNLFNFLSKSLGDEERRILTQALTGYSTLFFSESERAPVRYMDTVLRNSGFYLPNRNLEQNPKTWLQRIIAMRDRKQQAARLHVSSGKQGLEERMRIDLAVAKRNIIQFDAHRSDEYRLIGESIATLGHAGRLIDVSGKGKFTREEQENVLARFWLGIRYRQIQQNPKQHSIDEAQELLRLWKRTETEPVRYHELEDLGFDTRELFHYLTIIPYRTLRNCAYTSSYIQRYEKGVSEPGIEGKIAAYKLDIARRDVISLKGHALELLDDLMVAIYKTAKDRIEEDRRRRSFRLPSGTYMIEETNPSAYVFLSAESGGKINPVTNKGELIQRIEQDVRQLTDEVQLKTEHKRFYQLLAVSILRDYVTRI